VKSFRLANLWMVIAAFFFAVMGVFVKLASVKFSSAELVFYRSLVGLLSIFIFIRSNHLALNTPHLKFHIVRSTTGFISMLMFFFAIGALPLATAITLNYTSPLAMAAILTLGLKEKTKFPLIAALVTGFLGVVLLLKPSMNSNEWLAGTLGLVSGLSAGYVYVQVTTLGRYGEPAWRTVFYFSLTCTVGGGLWMLLHEFHPLTLQDFPILLGMGGSATIAQLAMTKAYREGNPLVAGSLAYSTVIFASLMGILLWNERLSPDRWIAIGLIIASGLISVISNQSKKS
jgi:drug/metabolite transporter (DMT)-like permease